MKLFFLLALKFGVLVALLALAVSTQNLKEIWALIAGVNFSFLLLFLVLNAAAVALSSSNIYLLLRPLGKGLPWRRLFYFDRLSLAGTYYTPGGTGGTGMLIFMMNREGVGLKDSTVAVLVDKGITLIVALFFLTVYLLVYHSGVLVIKWDWLGALAALLVLVAGVMYASIWVRQSAVKIIDRVRCYSGHYRLLTANLIISVGIFCLAMLQFVVAFYAVGVEVTDWLLILVSYGGLQLISILPITFGGIGLGETAAVFLWSGLGTTSEQILAAFLIARIFNLVSVLLLGGGAMIVWLLERREVVDGHGTA